VITTERTNDPFADLSCRELVVLVTDYLESALDPDAQRRFEAHIAACTGCHRYVDQMRRTVATLGRLGEADLSPAARDHLLAAFRGWKQDAAGG